MKKWYSKYGFRDNPDYPAWHCMTLTRCNDCGELFEADKQHICRKKNSYPWDMENDHIGEVNKMVEEKT